jgi:hypothetical protein
LNQPIGTSDLLIESFNRKPEACANCPGMWLSSGTLHAGACGFGLNE